MTETIPSPTILDRPVAAWLAHQTMLINENRLSPMNPQHRAFLEGEMEKFLFGGGAEKPAGYVPPET